MKRALQALALIVALSLLLVGCGGGKTASKSVKDTLLGATMKTAEAKSYAADVSLKIDKLDMSEGAISSEELAIASQVAAVIKDAAIQAKIVYDKDSSRTDAEVEVVLPGFMNMSLNIPMIMDGEKIYVKIPQIPFFPLPAEMTDKYVLVDMKELAEQTGEAMPAIDVAKQQKFAQELMSVAVKHFDEQKYFSEVKVADAGLPEQVKASNVIKFSLNADNYDETITILLDKVIPEIIDIFLNNEEYLNMVGADKAELEEAKQNIAANKEEAKQFLQDNIKINTVEVVSAIEKDYLVYQAVKFDVDVISEETGEKIVLALSATSSYSDLDKKPTFTQEIPADAVPFEELFGGMMMDDSFLFDEEEAE